jgi:hypothetical protein
VPVTSTARRSRPGRWPAGLAWALWALTLLGLAATVWLDRLLRQAGLPELTFLLGRGNFTAAVAAVRGNGRGGGGQPPASAPGGLAAGGPGAVHRRLRLRLLLHPLQAGGGAGSLVLRFRGARGLERLQLRWLAVGAALAAVALLIALTALVVENGDSTVLQAAVGVCVALLPLATGAAILRYRLYDIDRISRTRAYGLLTLLLGLGYAGVVLGLGPAAAPRVPAWS